MFDLDLLTEQNLNDSDILEYSNLEESYYQTTLNFIRECNIEYRDNIKCLYKSILESSSEEVVNESFSDFFEKVKSIIDKFIKFIKSLVERFIIAINKFIMSDKYLKAHKDRFKNFDSSKHSFEIKGYNYSIVEAVPVINALKTFDSSFVDLNFESLAEEKDQGKILKTISSKYSGLIDELNNDFYDKFRAEVLNQGGEIQSEDYADELFRIFRSGESDKEDIEIDNSFIIKAYARFENYKKIQNSTKNTKDKIEKDYNEIKKKVENLVKRNKDKDINKLIALSVNKDYDKAPGETIHVSNEVMSKIDLYAKAKANQVIEMSSIHSLAFSYKLDAIKDCYKQDKQVLYGALSKIAKDTKVVK